tara:strand:- start:1501 stop:2079 length:579 start_codon:yes stop_codon:yes gene_type:complete
VANSRVSSRIRAEDRVKVIKPEFFQRCGYPVTYQSEFDRIIASEEIKDEIGKCLSTCLKIAAPVDRSGSTQVGIHNVYRNCVDNLGAIQKIAKILAYESVRIKQHGGSQRKIYTKTIEKLAGKEFQVLRVRYVKTGTYIPPGFCGYAEGDWEPGYLEDAKTHKILELYWTKESTECMLDKVEIEGNNVVKVE